MKILSMMLLVLLSIGCATKGYVTKEVQQSEGRSNAQIEELKRMVEESQTEIRDLAEEMGVKIEGLEQTTGELERIAGDNARTVAALGQLRFQKTFSESEANFSSESDELSDTAKGELSKFAELVLAQNRMAHIEIQGHTDNRGSKEYNHKLGLRRAESVRNYLYKQHDIPLHLMSVISFGPDKPIASNNTSKGRSQNRRVVLVVRIQI